MAPDHGAIGVQQIENRQFKRPQLLVRQRRGQEPLETDFFAQAASHNSAKFESQIRDLAAPNPPPRQITVDGFALMDSTFPQADRGEPVLCFSLGFASCVAAAVIGAIVAYAIFGDDKPR